MLTSLSQWPKSVTPLFKDCLKLQAPVLRNFFGVFFLHFVSFVGAALCRLLLELSKVHLKEACLMNV
jgi:hypothetical protein